MSIRNSQETARDLRLAFFDKTLQPRSAASDSGFASQSNSDSSQYSTLTAWLKAIRSGMTVMRFSTHCRCDLRCLKTTFSIPAYGPSRIPTNDEVNLRTEVELEECVTHEVNHLDPFDDPHSCNTLAYVRQFATPLGRDLGVKRTPTTLCFFTSSALS